MAIIARASNDPRSHRRSRQGRAGGGRPRLRARLQPRRPQEPGRRQCDPVVRSTLHEEVTFDTAPCDVPAVPSWRFAEIPDGIEVVLVNNRPEYPAYDAGEPSTCPTAAALSGFRRHGRPAARHDVPARPGQGCLQLSPPPTPAVAHSQTQTLGPSPLAPAYIRTSAEPQVRPPPSASISTRWPPRMRPSATASASASGTEAAEVLAWRSIVTTTRSDGRHSRFPIASIIRRLA
jgi:hypothetical protein